MKSIIQLLSPILVGLIFAVNISTASAATCVNTDVSVNLIGGGTADANACRGENSGNDSPTYQNFINDDFGLDGTLTWYTDTGTGSNYKIEFANGNTIGTSMFSTSLMTNPFVIVVKASNNFAAYLFYADSTGSIDWSTIALGKGKHGISHLTLYTSTGGPGEVPLPAAIWLFGSALMGLVGIRKRYTA